MLGNFVYCNPTKLYFGKDSLDNLKLELKNYGSNILLVYGQNSIKNNGVYDRVKKYLKGKKVKEISGVMANPTLDKLYEGLAIVKSFKPDLILAIGGGSVIDYAKALSVTIYEPNKKDIWSKYWVKQSEPNHKIVPVGTVLTMVGTGSEFNSGSIITNTKTNTKIGKHFANTQVFPKFSILNPEFTYSIPYDTMVSGIFDIFSHLLEQYMSGNDDNTTDYIIEGLAKSLIHSSLIAIKDPTNYEARSNIMWTSTWALNTLLRKGKKQDWLVHKIGQSIGGLTNAPHGLTLSTISIAYYRHILPEAKDKLERLAKNVFDIHSNNLTTKQLANKAIDKLLEWMKQLKVCLHLKDLGVDKKDINKIVNNMTIFDNGYRTLSKQEIKDILFKSL